MRCNWRLLMSGCVVAAVCIGMAGSANADWAAYNDTGWKTGQTGGNITKYTSPNGGSGLPSSGLLKDWSTGQDTSVTLAVTGGDYNGTTQGDHGGSLAGDALAVFGGKVDPVGTISYIDAAGSNLVFTFTGMNAAKQYNLVHFAHRGNAAYGWLRSALNTISSADSFTNSSSVATDNNGNPLFSGPGDASTRLPADNPNGYIARFIDIDPGTNGTVVLTVSWDGEAGSEYKGKYSNALMLQEVPEPATLSLLALGGLTLGLRRRRR